MSASRHALDIERDSDVPISTQIFWQLAYQIESGRLQPGTRLPPVRELGAALRVNPNTIRAVYRRLADGGYVEGRGIEELFARSVRSVCAPNFGARRHVPAFALSADLPARRIASASRVAGE